jgi:uncharacterized protein (TIGR02996 family)
VTNPPANLTLTNTEEAALLAAVYARAQDDLPRLVYADWLEETGDPANVARAQFIRLQCAAGADASSEAAKQAKVLLKKNVRLWLGDVTRTIPGGLWTFERGFPHGVQLNPTRLFRLVEWSSAVFKPWPTVRALHAPQASNTMNLVRRAFQLTQFTELNISNMCVCGSCPIQDELVGFFETPEFAQLKLLNIAGNRVDHAVIGTLTVAIRVLPLESLDLSQNHLNVADFTALFSSSALVYLKHLRLRETQMGVRAARALVQSQNYGKLELLDLSRNRLGENGVRPLLSVPPPPALRSLDLRANELSLKTRQRLAEHFGPAVRLT